MYSIFFQELAKKEYPEILVDLLDVAFDKFRVIALNHSILLVALDKAKVSSLLIIYG